MSSMQITKENWAIRSHRSLVFVMCHDASVIVIMHHGIVGPFSDKG